MGERVVWTEESFRAALAKKAQMVETARGRLDRVVREFVDEFGYNGGKTGRPDYAAMIPLDRIDQLRRAADERDRIAARPLEKFADTTHTEPTEGR